MRIDFDGRYTREWRQWFRSRGQQDNGISEASAQIQTLAQAPTIMCQ